MKSVAHHTHVGPLVGTRSGVTLSKQGIGPQRADRHGVAP